MPADFSVSLDGSRTFLKVHALEQRVFAVFALDGKRRLLQLSFPLECGLLCPLDALTIEDLEKAKAEASEKYGTTYFAAKSMG